MDIVITDLDGTVLDEETYSFEEARPAITLLKSKSIPLVFCTSKTRREVEFWRRKVGNSDPFVAENGAAVYIPAGCFALPVANSRRMGEYDVVQLGTEYVELVTALQKASAESGCRVRGFHQMSTSEVSELCGLSPKLAEFAKEREFDEPFVILDPERETALLAAIQSAGKYFTRGGRFCHITGNNDKARAVQCLLGLYRYAHPGLRAIGLGDGPNDVPLLKSVDLPILMRSRWLRTLQAAVPNGRPTTSPGPKGWNQAIMAILGSPGTG